MSVKSRLLDWVDDRTEVDLVAKYVLDKLARYADGECCGWSPIKELMKVTMKSERTVRYKLRELEEAGLIRPTGRTHRLKDSTRSVPIYQLAPDVEGLGKRPGIGAETAPIETHGGNRGGGMGATGLPLQEPTEPTLEEANAPSSGAGAREQPSKYELATLAWPTTGQKRTDFVAALELWGDAAAEVGEARLLAAVMACAADPDARRGDHGYPGLHRWLREKRFRAYVPAVGAGAHGAGGPARTPFAGPAALRAGFVATHGEAAASWLDRCAWRDGVLTAATGIGAEWLRRNASAWLKANGLCVEKLGDRAGDQVGETA